MHIRAQKHTYRDIEQFREWFASVRVAVQLGVLRLARVQGARDALAAKRAAAYTDRQRAEIGNAAIEAMPRGAARHAKHAVERDVCAARKVYSLR